MRPYIIYLIIINLIGFLIMCIDKKRAINKGWRVPERTLFIIGIIGGSIGSMLAMNMVRHKTKQPLFKYGFPVILAMQIALAYVLSINK